VNVGEYLQEFGDEDNDAFEEERQLY
jgi:hypothetical protein